MQLIYGKNRPGWLGGYGDCQDIRTDRADGNWWYGKWTDIVCNIVGFIIGVYLKKGNIKKVFRL